MYGYGYTLFNNTSLSGESGPTVDPDAQLFITNAGITDPTQQTAIDTLVKDLKTYGIWSKMKAIYPFVGGTASTHKFNLKDPRDLDAAFRLVFSGGITHSINGVKPNGINAFADTKLLDTTMGGSLSLWYYSRESAASNTYIGSINKTILNPSGGVHGLNQNVSVGFTPPSNSNGFQGSSRTTISDGKAYRNGVSYVNFGTLTTAFDNDNYYLFQRRYVGQYASNQCAFAAIGEGLTQIEITNYYTAVQAFQTTLGRSIGTQTVSDADAQAFVTAANIQDQVEATAVNDLVVGLKADGIWSKMKAVYPFVGGTATSHKFNLKNPVDSDAAFRLVFNGGWTHSSTGALPNGTNAYANTYLNVNSVLSLNSTSLHYYSRTSGFSTTIMGCDNAAQATILTPKFSSGANFDYSVVNSNTGGIQNTSASSTQGLLSVNRNASNLYKGYRNGTSYFTTFYNSVAKPSQNVFIGARNGNGTPIQYTNLQGAFSAIGDGLTDTEAANFYTAVQNFQVALARNV